MNMSKGEMFLRTLSVGASLFLAYEAIDTAMVGFHDAMYGVPEGMSTGAVIGREALITVVTALCLGGSAGYSFLATIDTKNTNR